MGEMGLAALVDVLDLRALVVGFCCFNGNTDGIGCSLLFDPPTKCAEQTLCDLLSGLKRLLLSFDFRPIACIHLLLWVGSSGNL